MGVIPSNPNHPSPPYSSDDHGTAVLVSGIVQSEKTSLSYLGLRHNQQSRSNSLQRQACETENTLSNGC